MRLSYSNNLVYDLELCRIVINKYNCKVKLHVSNPMLWLQSIDYVSDIECLK